MIATTGGDGWWKGESRNANKNLLPSTMLECKTGLTDLFFNYQFSIHTAKVQGFFVTSKYLGSYLSIAPFFNARVIQLSWGYTSLLKLLTL